MTDKRCRSAALLLLLAAILYGLYTIALLRVVPTSIIAHRPWQSMSESQAENLQSISSGQLDLRHLSHLPENSSANKLDGFTHESENVLKNPKALDLGWPGFDVTCLDTVPSNDKLRESTSRAGHVEITYAICCNINRTGPQFTCKNASKPMIIPQHNAEAVHAAGQITRNLSTIIAERDFVFVTGASANHYRESLVLVRILQSRFPERKIVYWDIGLQADQVAEVRKFCEVVYKQLDFSKYPAHVRKLSTYAFKPLCIMETLANYPLLWWVDASIRFTGNNILQGLSMLGPRHGLVMFDDPGHSVWSTTYPQTYDYIATDVLGLQQTITCTGASFIVANTPEIFSTFLYWLYICALDERCIAPIDYPEYCHQQGPAVFARCHRFDQSVMTIIAANFWGFGSDSYRFLHDYFHLERSDDGRDDVRRCSATQVDGNT